ncbi:patatin-like phospholipase [Chrysochromulina ericina virus CeV-01B]|uniref:Patatin-like phospholipase n=1 Tax=Chrysochromulina ericina virus CeV-01B TaxID=3070830 RepID=A0A0N9QX80_9VIRU|nr:patatin-like phospholipase [Chrysochromulina ericina virus]ALH23118.1 patatin-like phospholipase [Chrysochromulina ericina virus CeV-01B]|tara:strand:+ start:909 stop:1778 length:870 start_codon:yes stop_codon:yes gene_type:complete
MTIKHLVLSGGGAAGFTVYGALKYLNKKNFFNLSDIKSIYASSAGSIIAGLVMLSENWDMLDDYILKRPWDKLININPTSLLNLWQKKGIFNEEMIKVILKPFLQAKEFDENITLKQLYEKTNIEIYMYTTNINSLELETVSLSYKSHPDLEFYKAITMSSAFPLMFMPICDASNCYVDGGLLNNFPLNNCINLNNDIDEILGIKISSNSNNIEYVNNDTLLPMYLYSIIIKMYILVNKKNIDIEIPNLVNCYIEDNSFSKWGNAVVDMSTRQEYISIGENSAKHFLEH